MLVVYNVFDTDIIWYDIIDTITRKTHILHKYTYFYVSISTMLLNIANSKQ